MVVTIATVVIWMADTISLESTDYTCESRLCGEGRGMIRYRAQINVKVEKYRSW